MTVSVWLIYLGLFQDGVVGRLCLETSHLSTHSSHLASYHTLNVSPKWCILLRKTKANGDGNQISIKIFFSGADFLLNEKEFPKNGLFLLETYLYCKKWIHFSSSPLPKQTGVFYTGVVLSCVISQTHPVVIPLYHFAALSQHTWNHRMSPWRVQHPKTSKNHISGVPGQLPPLSSLEEPPAQTQSLAGEPKPAACPEKRAMCYSSL